MSHRKLLSKICLRTKITIFNSWGHNVVFLQWNLIKLLRLLKLSPKWGKLTSLEKVKRFSSCCYWSWTRTGDFFTMSMKFIICLITTQLGILIHKWSIIFTQVFRWDVWVVWCCMCVHLSVWLPTAYTIMQKIHFKIILFLDTMYIRTYLLGTI